MPPRRAARTRPKKLVTPSLPAREDLPMRRCTHENVLSKNLSGCEVMVCMDCSRAVNPKQLPFETPLVKVNDNIVVQIPLPDEFCIARKDNLERGNVILRLVYNPSMTVNLEGMSFVPVPSEILKSGDVIKVVRENGGA